MVLMMAPALVPFLSLAAVFYFFSLAFRRDGYSFGVWIVPIVIGLPVLLVPLSILVQFQARFSGAVFVYSTVVAPLFAVVFTAAMATRFPRRNRSLADE